MVPLHAQGNKRGISYTPGADKAVRGLKVSWCYNWSPEPPTNLPPGVEFVPMVWGWKGDSPQVISRLQANRAAGRFTSLLGFNEPDGTPEAGGSQMTVQQALDAWPQLQKVNAKLGAPGCVNSLSPWMKEFMREAEKRGYRIDFIPVHCYPADAASFLGYLDAVHREYPRYPIWVTEFAPADWGAATAAASRVSVASSETFARAVLPALQTRPWLERYAWFSAPVGEKHMGNAALWQADGKLTTCGTLYAGAPSSSDKDAASANAWPFPARSPSPAPAAPPVAPTPEAVPTAVADPNEPRSKSLLLVQMPDGAPTAFPVSTVTTLNGMVTAAGMDGTRAIWRQADVAGRLVWHTDQELKSGEVDLEKLGAEYQRFAADHAAWKGVLEPETARIQRVENLFNARRELLARSYLPEASYRVQTLRELLKTAEELKKELPGSSAQLVAFVEPFQAHLEHLENGQIQREGKWLTTAQSKADLLSVATADRLRVSLPSPVLARSELLRAFAVPIGLGAGVFLLGLVMLAGHRRSAWTRVLGLGVCGAVVAAAGYFSQDWQRLDGSNLAGQTNDGDARKVALLLARFAQSTPEYCAVENHVELTDADLNAFIQQRVAIETNSPATGRDLQRTGLDAGFVPNGIVVHERLRLGTRELLATYRWDFSTLEKGWSVRNLTIRVGGSEVPAGLADLLRQKMTANLQKACAKVPDTHKLVLRLGSAELTRQE